MCFIDKRYTTAIDRLRHNSKALRKQIKYLDNNMPLLEEDHDATSIDILEHMLKISKLCNEITGEIKDDNDLFQMALDDHADMIGFKRTCYGANEYKQKKPKDIPAGVVTDKEIDEPFAPDFVKEVLNETV